MKILHLDKEPLKIFKELICGFPKGLLEFYGKENLWTEY